MNSKVLSLLIQYKNVLIIGPYPPPLGGVSVHIYRLHKSLPTSKILNLSMVASNKKSFYLNLFYQIITHNCDLIHLHRYNLKLMLFIYLIRKIKNIDFIATSHNARLFENLKPYQKKLYRYLINKLDCLIVVSRHILEKYNKNGISLPDRVIVEPAFLAPPIKEEKKILQTYPKDCIDFLSQKSPMIVANAFKIVFHEGIDLYGMDMCVELTAALRKRFSNVGFVFALAEDNTSRSYFENIMQRIKELDIVDNFYFLKGQKELWPIFKKADLMIRPTTTDGDAISIREALYFRCPVIASNVFERPTGTILFRSRDLKDLLIKSLHVLDTKTDTNSLHIKAK